MPLRKKFAKCVVDNFSCKHHTNIIIIQLANGGSPQQGAAPFLILPVRQETPDMNTVRMPFKRETDDKTFPQNVLVLDTTFL